MNKLLTEVEFRLGIELEDFIGKPHNEFVAAFAAISNTTVAEIKTLWMIRGCTMIRLRLPEEAAKAFLELYHKYAVETYSTDVCPEDLRAFIEKFKVENFTRYRSDIEIVIREKPKRRAIAFVHGWRGDETTFGSWPSFLWNEFRCKAEVFEYPTGILTHSPSTLQLGAALGEWIRNRFPDSSLALITHSLGGLVARRFIIDAQTAHDRLDLTVRNIVFAASPHGGKAVAKIASKIPVLTSDQVRELSSGSTMLQDLNIRWSRWTERYTPNPTRIKCYYGSADRVVTAVEAQGLDPEPIPILGKGHRSLVKPADESDPIARSVRRFLLETKFFEDAPGSELDREKLQSGFFRDLDAQAKSGPTQPAEGERRIDVPRKPDLDN